MGQKRNPEVPQEIVDHYRPARLVCKPPACTKDKSPCWVERGWAAINGHGACLGCHQSPAGGLKRAATHARILMTLKEIPVEAKP